MISRQIFPNYPLNRSLPGIRDFGGTEKQDCWAELKSSNSSATRPIWKAVPRSWWSQDLCICSLELRKERLAYILRQFSKKGSFRVEVSFTNGKFKCKKFDIVDEGGFG